MHELWLVKGSSMIDITPIVGSISWNTNVDELGAQLDFNIADNDIRFFPKNPCDIGDMVLLKRGNYEITRAIVVDENKSGRSPVGYTAFDPAFYFNKSNAIYQFNSMPAAQAITKICKDFNVPIGWITWLSTPIKKIYNDEKVSDIIKDIIETAERAYRKKFYMEMKHGKLYVQPYEDLLIKGTFQLADNLVPRDLNAAIASPSKTRSITDMINSIQIVDSNDKLVLTQSDDTNLNKYGKLQKVIQMDEEEKRSARQIAQNELNQFSKIIEESRVTLLGNDQARAGRMIDLEEPVTGINGRYLIKSANHSISAGVHTMSLGLGAV